MAQQMDASLVPLVEQGYKLWRVVNDVHCGGKLPAPVLIIAPNSRLKDQNRLGWCSTDQVWTTAKTEDDLLTGAAAGAFEIGLAAEHLYRSVEEICVTWGHEFAHYLNWSATPRIEDANPNTQYHNKKFKERAEQLGMVVERSDKGWNVTKIGEGFRELITKAQLDESVFEWCRLGAAGGQRKKAPTKMKKWSCACTNIRAAVKIEARCLKCGNVFENQDAEGEEE